MLNDILAKEGLERVDQAGVPFDPTCHDAVAHSEAEDGDDGGTVGGGSDALRVPLEGATAPAGDGPRPGVS